MSEPPAEQPELNGELAFVLEQLSNISLEDIDRKTALRKAADLACRVLKSEACAIVSLDVKAGTAEHVACAGKKELASYLCERRVRLGNLGFARALIERGEIVERYDLIQEGYGALSPQVARQYRLHSLLACPLRNEGGIFGYLLHFSTNTDPFPLAERRLVDLVARHISIAVERLEDFASRRRLQRLTSGMQRLAEAQSEEQLLEVLLQVGMELVHAPHGAVAMLNFSTGELEISKYAGEQPNRRSLLSDQGVTNHSLRREEPVLVEDVKQAHWVAIYADLWSDTRSELAVPIILTGAAVRRGAEVVRAARPFGVLNFESPEIGAFSQTDADLLWSLVRYSVVLLDRLETERKQRELANVHQEILGKADWNETIDVMMRAIKDTLGYPYINISLVRQDIGRIKTEYVMGIAPAETDTFKELADHELNSGDIQADVVRTRQIEVPASDDPRFDPKVYDSFGHKDYLRVFLPMIAPSDNRVIGTLEAGFRKSQHRQHIYEEDVQILKAFIEYAAHALDRRQAYVLDKIGHEFRAPVAGIRNNARFMQRHIEGMRPYLVQNKLNDIITDCEILLSQLARLEHILGKTSPQPKVAPTVVFRDVVIKTVRQSMPELTRQGLNPDGFKYDPADVTRLGVLWVDKARLSQVFLNLITNCIKYADKRDVFDVRLELEEIRDAWLIHVKDWGIGVKPEYADRIFQDGFRTPEARECNPTGSGLGLTISRQIMKEIGGDLHLSRMYKPTEFVVRLPKSLARKPKENRNDPHG